MQTLRNQIFLHDIIVPIKRTAVHPQLLAAYDTARASAAAVGAPATPAPAAAAPAKKRTAAQVAKAKEAAAKKEVARALAEAHDQEYVFTSCREQHFQQLLKWDTNHVTRITKLNKKAVYLNNWSKVSTEGRGGGVFSSLPLTVTLRASTDECAIDEAACGRGDPGGL